MKPKAILSNRLYVPTEYVSPIHRELFTHKLPTPFEVLEEDEQYVLLFKELSTGYTGFHRGDMGLILKTFEDFQIVDERTRIPLRYPLMLTTPLYPHQREAVEQWLNAGYGHLLAPPRSGKTVMMTALTCILGQRTIILAAQWEWLQQFEQTLRAFTNIPDLERILGRTIVKLVETREDIGRHDIVLSTYQKFLSPKGRKFLSTIRDRFGLVVVDEADQSSAAHYSRVVGRLNSLYRVGCTATHERKDGKECIAFNILGPVTAKCDVEQMDCLVKKHHTGYVAPYWHSSRWYLFYRRITEDIERNRLIVARIKQSVEDGRFVVAVTNRTNHIETLTRMLIEQGVTEVYGYWGKSPDRDKFLERANQGKLRVVIAQRKMVQRALDVPLWDSYHCLIPTANKFNYYQECSRIRTPKIGKRTPEIVYYLDTGHSPVQAMWHTASIIHTEQGFTVKEDNPIPEPKSKKKPKLSKRMPKWGKD